LRATGKLLTSALPAGDLMRTTFASSSAIQVGKWGNLPAAMRPPGAGKDDPIVARFAIVPREGAYPPGVLRRAVRGVKYLPPFNRDRQYQRRLAAERLKKGPVELDVMVQFFVDDRTTPLDDSSVEWSDQASPPVRVATVRLDQAEAWAFQPDRFSDFERVVLKHGSFGPQIRARKIAVPALPASQMNRDRDPAYAGSNANRDQEPPNRALEPFVK
jgi:hypothetical protein